MIRLARFAPLIGTLLLNACAPPPHLADCDGNAQRPPYARIGAADTLMPATTSAIPRVAHYRMVPARRDVTRCMPLRLRKQLVLTAPLHGRTSILEIQDFYAGNGTFIVRNTEDVSAQLAHSGRYARTLVLPVPASTPPGRYRVVSRLVAREGRREIPLATAVAEFRVRRTETTSGSRARPETPR